MTDGCKDIPHAVPCKLRPYVNHISLVCDNVVITQNQRFFRRRILTLCLPTVTTGTPEVCSFPAMHRLLVTPGRVGRRLNCYTNWVAWSVWYAIFKHIDARFVIFYIMRNFLWFLVFSGFLSVQQSETIAVFRKVSICSFLIR